MPTATIFTCAGLELSVEEAAFFKDVDPFGFILFADNIKSPDQLRRLTESMRACVDREDAPILLDQEGGRVARLQPPQWRRAVLAQLPNIQLTVLVGRYALSAHIEGAQRQAVTNVVAAWRDHRPAIMPLPHPSPRNTRWLRDRPWVEADLIPALQERVSAILAPT